MRLIDADKLVVDARLGDDETPYVSKTQIDEAPTVEAIPIDKPFLKMKYKGYTVYKNEWLKEHIDMEYRVIKGISETKAEAIPVEWIRKWNKQQSPLIHGLIAYMLFDWEKENG